MRKKTGITQQTLRSIINATKIREKLHPSVTVSWRDIDRTKSLEDKPEIWRQLNFILSLLRCYSF